MFRFIQDDSGSLFFYTEKYNKLFVDSLKSNFKSAVWKKDIGAWVISDVEDINKFENWYDNELPKIVQIHNDRENKRLEHEFISPEEWASSIMRAEKEPISSEYVDLTKGKRFWQLSKLPFGDSLISLIKEIPGAKYIKDAKSWVIPFTSYDSFIKVLPEIEKISISIKNDINSRRFLLSENSVLDLENSLSEGSRQIEKDGNLYKIEKIGKVFEITDDFLERHSCVDFIKGDRVFYVYIDRPLKDVDDRRLSFSR